MAALLLFLSLLTGSTFIPFFRVVVDQDDHETLVAFQQEFYKRSGMHVSLEYLSQARVTLFYWGTQRVCGYVLNTADWNMLRYFSFFTPTMSQNMLADRGMHLRELIELTCLWKVKKLPPLFSAIFYASMLIDACRIGGRYKKRFLIGGSVLGTIRHLQRQLLTTDIFIGFLPDSELRTHDNQLVAIYSCELRQIPLRATWLLANRFLVRGNPILQLIKQIKRILDAKKVGRLAGRVLFKPASRSVHVEY